MIDLAHVRDKRTSTGALSPRPADSHVRPMHIAFALGGTDLGRSGIGTYVREVLPPLIEQLTATGGSLTAFGSSAELAAYTDVLHGAIERRAPVAMANKPGLNALWHLAFAGKFARHVRADVLLLPAANRRLVAHVPIPTVAVVHDLAQLRVANKYDRLRMFYFRRVLLPALRAPNRLVAVSGATRDDLLRTLNIPRDRVSVVYNGVNSHVFRSLDTADTRVREARDAAGLADRPYLLYPARLEHPGKNHLRLLQAFARSGLAESHTLVLTGGDWGARELIEAAVRDLCLERSVKLLGFVAATQLPALVAGADAVLMLGLHEGFGLPALEGLSAGRPVCVSNTGALPEVVGDLGVRCDPFSNESIADALRRVVTDHALRARCQTEGPAWAERFTWTRTSAGLLQACNEALSSAHP